MICQEGEVRGILDEGMTCAGPSTGAYSTYGNRRFFCQQKSVLFIRSLTRVDVIFRVFNINSKREKGVLMSFSWS